MHPIGVDAHRGEPGHRARLDQLRAGRTRPLRACARSRVLEVGGEDDGRAEFADRAREGLVLRGFAVRLGEDHVEGRDGDPGLLEAIEEPRVHARGHGHCCAIAPIDSSSMAISVIGSAAWPGAVRTVRVSKPFSSIARQGLQKQSTRPRVRRLRWATGDRWRATAASAATLPAAGSTRAVVGTRR
jgi:hypothetical protein